jgi:hypothetical protein
MDASLLWIVVAVNALTTAEPDGREHPLRRDAGVPDRAGRSALSLVLRGFLDCLSNLSAVGLAQPRDSRVRSGWIRALCDVAIVPAQRTSRRRD